MVTVQAWWGLTPASGGLDVVPAGVGWQAGNLAADRAIDAGAGALIIVDGTAPTPAARAIGAVLCGVDASRALPQEADALAWMHTCAAVRDHMPSIRAVAHDPAGMAACDERVAWWTAVLTTAARRHTPVVVAGVNPLLAALCARALAPDLPVWLQVGFDDDDPLAQLVRTRLDLRPWYSSGLPLDDDLRHRVLELTLIKLGAVDGSDEVDA